MADQSALGRISAKVVGALPEPIGVSAGGESRARLSTAWGMEMAVDVVKVTSSP